MRHTLCQNCMALCECGTPDAERFCFLEFECISSVVCSDGLSGSAEREAYAAFEQNLRAWKKWLRQQDFSGSECREAQDPPQSDRKGV